jgi:hypothetical protein
MNIHLPIPSLLVWLAVAAPCFALLWALFGKVTAQEYHPNVQNQRGLMFAVALGWPLIVWGLIIGIAAALCALGLIFLWAAGWGIARLLAPGQRLAASANPS